MKNHRFQERQRFSWQLRCTILCFIYMHEVKNEVYMVWQLLVLSSLLSCLSIVLWPERTGDIVILFYFIPFFWAFSIRQVKWTVEKKIRSSVEYIVKITLSAANDSKRNTLPNRWAPMEWHFKHYYPNFMDMRWLSCDF